jgi:hypothetical protein
MRAFVGVLKATPSAHVVDQDVVKIGMTRPHVVKQLDQAGPVLDFKPALTFVAVRPDNRELMQVRVRRDHGSLILDGVSLVIGRHADILCRAQSRL